MAYVQRNSPSPNRTLNFSLKNFAGGMNNVSDQLKDNEASSLLNMSFADEVLMEKRKGTEAYDALITYDDATPAVADDTVFIDEYKPYNADNVLIRASSKNVYFGSTKVLDCYGQISGVNDNGRYYIADGEKLYVYGIFPQTDSTHIKVTGTAVATAVLMEVVTPTAGFTPLDASYVEGVTQYNYTTLKVAYEPCQNELDDVYKGANVVPAGIKYLITHNARLFASGASKDNDNVFITDIERPYYFPVGLPLQLTPNSDVIVGMNIYDDNVVVGRHDDIYMISGDTNNPALDGDMFKIKRLNTHTGFANHKATSVVNNYLFYLGSDGNVYALSSTQYDTDKLLTVNISKQLDIFKSPIDLTLADISNSCSVFYKDEWYLAIKDKVLIYSYKNKAWTMWNGLNATSFYILDGVLLWGNTSGITATFDEDGFLDFTVPYQAYWWSKYFDMDESNSYKHFKEFFVIAHTYVDLDSDIRLLFEIDYADVTDMLEIVNRISMWGEAVWGNRFVDRNVVESLPLFIGWRGRNIRFKISNGYVLNGTVATVADLNTVLAKHEGMLIKVTATNAYYLYTLNSWVLMADIDINQRMKVYQINGEYELRGKR